jgi:hypothetical protein
MKQFAGNEVQVWRYASYLIRGRRTGTVGFLDEVHRAVWSVNPNLSAGQHPHHAADLR